MRSSNFYYKKSGGAKGVKPSTHSMNRNEALFENASVVKDIEKTLHQEFCCYGYRNMTGELKNLGWLINHKKVYRLMRSISFYMVDGSGQNHLSGILSNSESLVPKDRCNTYRWTSNMFTFMDGKEMCCCLQ
jgi:hypothetical protein